MHVVACLECRHMRVKCQRHDHETGTCIRCQRMELECIVPQRRLGRKPGSKNRSTLRRVAPLPIAKPSTLQDNELQGDQRATTTSFFDAFSTAIEKSSETPLTSPTLTSRLGGTASPLIATYDMLSNPLHILAFTSATLENPYRGFAGDIQELACIITASKPTLDYPSDLALIKSSLELVLGEEDALPLPDRQRERLDQARPDNRVEGEGNDAVDLGLVSEEEANDLFLTYIRKFNPIVRILDESLHTLEYVRRRSSSLLAVVLKTAAIIVNSKSLYTRLSNHVTDLIAKVHSSALSSVEICQALILHCMWLPPLGSRHDPAWQYAGMALMSAMELRLDTLLPYAVASDPEYMSAGPEVKARLVRNSHRTWLTLYNWDKATANFRRRPAVLPECELTSAAFLQQWHCHPQATAGDVCVAGAVILRKHETNARHQLFVNISEKGFMDFELAKTLVDAELSRWRLGWQLLVSGAEERAMGTSHTTYDLTALCSRFLILATPYESLLEKNMLDHVARDDCLAISLETCLKLTGFLDIICAKNFTSPYIWPNMTLTMYVWVLVLSIKMLQLAPQDGVQRTSDLFHLAIIGRVASQLKKVGDIIAMASPAALFGTQILAAVRQHLSEHLSTMRHDTATFPSFNLQIESSTIDPLDFSGFFPTFDQVLPFDADNFSWALNTPFNVLS